MSTAVVHLLSKRWPGRSPYDDLDYTAGFTDFLEDDEKIASFTIAITPTGDAADLADHDASISSDGKKVIPWLKAGNGGVGYAVRVTITSDASPIPRKASRIWHIHVEDI